MDYFKVYIKENYSMNVKKLHANENYIRSSLRSIFQKIGDTL